MSIESVGQFGPAGTPGDHGGGALSSGAHVGRPRLVAVVLVLVLCLVALVVFAGSLLTMPPPQANIVFLNPTSGEKVVSPLEVSLSGEVPAGMEVWVLTVPPDQNYYTTSAKPVRQLEDGTWRLPPIGLGRGSEDGDRGFEYDLVAVTVSARSNSIRDELQRSTAEGRAMFETVPAGATQVASVRVELTAWSK